MTQSDNPNGAGPHHGQPQQPQIPGQQPVPPQQVAPPAIGADPHQTGLNPDGTPVQPYQPAMGAPAQGGYAPVQQQPVAPQGHQQPVAGHIPPQAPSGTYEVPYAAEPQLDPALSGLAPAPMDDYQYPQGQSILPDVPSVAVPPGTQPVHAAYAPSPQTDASGIPPQGLEGGYADPAGMGSSGEQISQRLAQLQNQYDEELSAENWNASPAPAQNAHQMPVGAPPANMAQTGDAFTGYHTPPIDENPAYPPLQADATPQQQGYQQQPTPHDSYQQAQEGYHEPQQQAQHAPPPLAHSLEAYGEHGQMMEAPAQQYNNTSSNTMAAPSIAQELPSGGGMKKLMLGGAFVAALAVGGGAAYTYQFTDIMGGNASGGSAPTIKAASSPIKILKNKIAGATDSINKAVHNRLSGGSLTDSGTSTLADGGQLVKKTMAGAKVASANSGMLPGIGNGSAAKNRLANAPRRVKTLIVRPDGTILRPAGQDSAASSGSDMAKMAVAPGINAASIPKSGGNKIRRMKTIGEASIARRITDKAGSSVVKTAAKPTAGPAIRKIKTIQAARVRSNAIAPVKTVKRSVVAAAPSGDIGSPFVVQVTSRSSQTSALAAFADMQQKYPSLIGTYAPDIQRADLGTKGVWYRLRVGPVGSKTVAADLCSNLKQAGHPGCFVRRK